MKFRNPKTGNVFTDIRDVHRGYCYKRRCDNCALRGVVGNVDCTDYTTKNPVEAARLMGYEVLDESVEQEQVKPLGKWMLEEIAEECAKTGGENCNGCMFFYDKHGCRIDDLTAAGAPMSWDLNVPLEKDPDSLPRLTSDELAICRGLGAKWVSRDDSENSVVDLIDLWESKPQKADDMFINGNRIGVLKSHCIPSVRPGDCICVEGVQK